jgi:hypothetical protein
LIVLRCNNLKLEKAVQACCLAREQFQVNIRHLLRWSDHTRIDCVLTARTQIIARVNDVIQILKPASKEVPGSRSGTSNLPSMAAKPVALAESTGSGCTGWHHGFRLYRLRARVQAGTRTPLASLTVQTVGD